MTATFSPSTRLAPAVQPSQFKKPLVEPEKNLRLVECGYTCRDCVWYRVVKLESTSGRQVPLRNAPASNGEYVCRDGIWYRRINISEWVGRETDG